MNYLAHALPFLDNPYRVAGTAVPDWLMVCDRRTRTRTKHVAPHVDDADPVVAAIAGGIVQHLRDDRRFHESRAFAELTLEFSAQARRRLPDDAGFRPSMVGHLLVEVLLDAALIDEDPRRLEIHDAALAAVEPWRIEETVNRMVAEPATRLATMIDLFRRERVLWDYLDDAKLMVRLNQVMRRLNFTPLPTEFAELLPTARRMVAARRGELLDGIPVPWM
jgi:hypothetical protein